MITQTEQILLIYLNVCMCVCKKLQSFKLSKGQRGIYGKVWKAEMGRGKEVIVLDHKNKK